MARLNSVQRRVVVTGGRSPEDEWNQRDGQADPDQSH